MFYKNSGVTNMENEYNLEEIQHAGVISLVGGTSSFALAAIVLFFLRKKEAMHFCNPAVLFTYIILHCASSLCYFLQGALIIGNPEFAEHSQYYSYRVLLRAAEEYVFLVWIFVTILIFYDSFLSFSNPFKKRRFTALFISVAFLIPFIIVVVFLIVSPCHHLIENSRTNILLLVCLPIIITACILFHCKLARQSAYYNRLMQDNFLLRQTVRVQRCYLFAFSFYFLWEIVYFSILPGKLQCKLINTAVKSFTSSIVMIPFVGNIWKMYTSFPREMHQISLANWTVSQLRNGIVTFIMKGFQEVFGRKGGVNHKKDELAFIESSASFCEPASFLSEKLVDNEPLDSSDREYWLNSSEEAMASDFLIASQVEGKCDGQKIKLVELAPKVFREIRKIHGVSNKLLLETFSVKKYKEGKMSVSVHVHIKEEKLIILPPDTSLILKTLPDKEFAHFKDIVTKYFEHVRDNPSSLLFPLLGIYTLNFPPNLYIDPMHFMIMKCVISPNKAGQIRFIVAGEQDSADVGQRLDLNYCSSEEMKEVLTHPSRITEVRNLKLCKCQIQCIVDDANVDIAYLQGIHSSCYNLYFIGMINRGNPMVDLEIKDAIVFDSNIEDKLFVYRLKERGLILQKVTSTHSIEYHVGEEKDLVEIEGLGLVEALRNGRLRESRIVESGESAREKRRNLQICFSAVREAVWTPQEREAFQGVEMLHPEALLCDSCALCREHTNHICISYFSDKLPAADDLGPSSHCQNQVIVTWSGDRPDVWLCKYDYKIINYMGKCDTDPTLYKRKFMDCLNSVLISDK